MTTFLSTFFSFQFFDRPRAAVNRAQTTLLQAHKNACVEPKEATGRLGGPADPPNPEERPNCRSTAQLTAAPIKIVLGGA